MSEELSCHRAPTRGKQNSTQKKSISLPDINLSLWEDFSEESHANTCKRCHRALKDSVSIKRGYGPVCWKKLQQGEGKQKKIAEPRTVAYAGLANHTMREIRKRVLQGKVQTCSCGESLEAGELHSYDHDGGYNLKGFGKPQWVYLECSKCGHQLSIWKLRIDLSDLEKLKSVMPEKQMEAVV